jgi:hypothetical protein
MMLFAVSVHACDPNIISKKLCHCPKPALHSKCTADSLSKTRCNATLKRVDIQAKKVTKDEPKSIFSGLFSFEFPTSAIEDFFLSAQKVLVEKLS